MASLAELRGYDADHIDYFYFFFVLAVPMILPGVCNYGFDLHVSFH